jgi:hypothetical protein
MIQLLMLTFFVVTLLGLSRSILIILGFYKDPILHSFEQYGPNERLPLPLITLLLWAGAFTITFSVWSSAAFGVNFPMAGLGAALIVAGISGMYWYPTVSKWYYRVFPYPRWHQELLSRTTRYERRRIAYMWLHLPFRLRLTYNSSDTSFFLWADFVIMGTIRDEESELYDEAFYAGR